MEGLYACFKNIKFPTIKFDFDFRVEGHIDEPLRNASFNYLCGRNFGVEQLMKTIECFCLERIGLIVSFPWKFDVVKTNMQAL